jgi:argininosuccinate lyase
MNQNFGFISLPEELTTGSSIMPHKKNPDVFEIIRGKCNKLQALPNEIALITTNLPSGYHRDLQVVKESFLPAFRELQSCLNMMTYMLKNVLVKDNILQDEKYSYLFSVEVVNNEVLQGVPFREAYKKIGSAIADGSFVAPDTVNHTHEGSIGNLNNENIKALMAEVVRDFNFQQVTNAINDLVAP